MWKKAYELTLGNKKKNRMKVLCTLQILRNMQINR